MFKKKLSPKIVFFKDGREILSQRFIWKAEWHGQKRNGKSWGFCRLQPGAQNSPEHPQQEKRPQSWATLSRCLDGQLRSVRYGMLALPAAAQATVSQRATFSPIERGPCSHQEKGDENDLPRGTGAPILPLGLTHWTLASVLFAMKWGIKLLRLFGRLNKPFTIIVSAKCIINSTNVAVETKNFKMRSVGPAF